MTDFGIQPDQLRRLARLVEEAGLSELRYESGDFVLALRTSPEPPPATPFYPLSLPPYFAPGEAGEEQAPFSDPAASGHPVPAEESKVVRIEAPLMGVFYRSSTPDEPPFVEVGDSVEAGQVIGLIEAMKVFSEVPAEVAGRVREIPVRNATLVQPGDTLVVLEVE